MSTQFEIEKLSSNQIALAKELMLMFQLDDGIENPTLPSENYLTEILAKDDFHVIVALKNNQLIGGLTAYEIKMFKRETIEMFLFEIGVEKSQRKKGVATALIEFLKEICIAKGIIEMFVGTGKDNLAARRLYLTTGGKADENSVWFNYLFD